MTAIVGLSAGPGVLVSGIATDAGASLTDVLTDDPDDVPSLLDDHRDRRRRSAEEVRKLSARIERVLGARFSSALQLKRHRGVQEWSAKSSIRRGGAPSLVS
jgi:hypothetical protein